MALQHYRISSCMECTWPVLQDTIQMDGVQGEQAIVWCASCQYFGSSFYANGVQAGQARGARAAHPLHRCLNVISQLLEDPDVVRLLDNVRPVSIHYCIILVCYSLCIMSKQNERMAVFICILKPGRMAQPGRFGLHLALHLAGSKPSNAQLQCRPMLQLCVPAA